MAPPVVLAKGYWVGAIGPIPPSIEKLKAGFQKGPHLWSSTGSGPIVLIVHGSKEEPGKKGPQNGGTEGGLVVTPGYQAT